MEPEVLAQHQVVELQKLRDRYMRWLKDVDNVEISDIHASISIGQTGVMLRVFIADINEILEQS